MINDHNTTESEEWKIQLNMHVNFFPNNDIRETRITNILSDNEEIMLGSNTYDIITNLFISLFDNYQRELGVIRGASDFKFESVELLDDKPHKIRLKRRGSYIKSPEWIRNKRAAINPKNEDDNNCFHYAITIALNHQYIGDHPERISNIKLLLINIIGKG